jgi:hypothetical protein
MLSSGMLHSVALLRTDLSDDLSASVIRMTRINELGTVLVVKNGVFRGVTPGGSWYFFAACVGWQLQIALFLV